MDKQNGTKLTFKDLFFISFGGQAPFISLLTFGTVMISEVGTKAPLAMLTATIVVLFNGLVIYFLSKRFKRGGGYYTYAFYSLTSRLGINTGWNYLLYALSYGGTLLTGGAYVLYTVMGKVIPNFWLLQEQWFYTLIISVIAMGIVLAGVQVSAKYAIGASTIEIIIILGLSILFLYYSRWNFYNPIPSYFPTSIIPAVIFGLGIPTGYGSIAPLGGEADSKTIGKVAISVLLFGGLLATFFFYSLAAMDFTGNLVDFLLFKFGVVSIIVISIIALSDGILGGMAYILADSRTLKAMAEDKVMIHLFSRQKVAEAVIGVAFVIVLTIMTYYFGLFYTFSILGAMAGLNNLFVHISANFSLIRTASKRALKHIHEILIGIIAILISASVFLYSLPSFNKYIVYLFFGWIILGFIYAETLEILRESSEE
ncbi:APC family permease [Sulfolobus tengchongensis]|uniref:APC family permease n=1 Tax=Sulfolobus tengchongensis TaxID=207809 RepID=A0AAX4L142_9CREN